MTDFGFIAGCAILATGIWGCGYYINRALQAAGYKIAAAIKSNTNDT